MLNIHQTPGIASIIGSQRRLNKFAATYDWSQPDKNNNRNGFGSQNYGNYNSAPKFYTPPSSAMYNLNSGQQHPHPAVTSPPASPSAHYEQLYGSGAPGPAFSSNLQYGPPAGVSDPGGNAYQPPDYYSDTPAALANGLPVPTVGMERGSAKLRQTAGAVSDAGMYAFGGQMATGLASKAFAEGGRMANGLGTVGKAAGRFAAPAAGLDIGMMYYDAYHRPDEVRNMSSVRDMGRNDSANALNASMAQRSQGGTVLNPLAYAQYGGKGMTARGVIDPTQMAGGMSEAWNAAKSSGGNMIRGTLDGMMVGSAIPGVGNAVGATAGLWAGVGASLSGEQANRIYI